MIGLRINLGRYLGGGVQSTPPSSNWILAAGTWNDSGVWDDSASWID